MQIIRTRNKDRYTTKLIAQGHQFGLNPQPTLSHMPGHPIEATIDITTDGIEEDGKTRYQLHMTVHEAISLGQKLLDSGKRLKDQYDRSVAAGKIIND